MLDLMADVFGLNWAELNVYQKEKLEDAYDKSLCETNDNSAAGNTLLYGGYEPIVVTITHILNERASIGWTSYSHTGVPVPIFAEGREAWRFAGFYDSHIAMFLLFMAKGLPAANVLNAPFVAAEVLNILVGSFGLVTVAPFTALVAGLLYRGHAGEGESARIRST